MGAAVVKPIAHVVDVLGNVIGRDQPIMLMEKAMELVLLLGEENFKDDDIVFFDPFCKAGEILLSCAFHSCVAKSNRSALADVDQIQKELYQSGRYFALAPDERHHRLSLRTFLGNTNSHNEAFNHIIRDGHYVSETDGRLNREKFVEEFNSMLEYIKTTSKKKKIIAVGNPPYQENDGGFGGSASSVYNYFVEALMDSKDIAEAIVVIPSRWFTTGKGATKFRERILKSRSIKAIKHFKYSKSVFPTVDILGGVCFFHYDANHDGPTTFTDGTNQTVINLSECDIILDDPKGYDLIKRIQGVWKGRYVSEIAWTVRPFGIRTFYFVRGGSLDSTNPKAVPCFTKRRKIMYANIDDIPKNKSKIDEWKVAVPKAYAPGSKMGVRRVTLPVDQYFIIPKGHITTETYNIVGCFKTKKEAENFISYLTTDFARYLLGLRKVTQDIYKNQWDWVPLVEVDKAWSDSELYKQFGITPKEQEHIRAKLREWS